MCPFFCTEKSKKPLPLEIWRLFSVWDHVISIVIIFQICWLSLSPAKRTCGCLTPGSVLWTDVCVPFLLDSLFGGDSLVLFPSFAQILFFFQIAHKAAGSSWWEDKEPALFLAILGREAVKLGYLRAENRWFTAEQLHGNQWEVVLENVAYCSERLLGRVLQAASSDSDSFLQTLYWVTISTGHPNLSLLPRAEFLSSLLHKHTGQALGSGPKHFYTVYPFLMIMQQPFNLQIHHWCPPPTRPPGDLSLLLCPHQHLLLSSQYFQADHWE